MTSSTTRSRIGSGHRTSRRSSPPSSAFKSVPKYAHRAKLKEVQENEFNLNIPRYVDSAEEEKEADIPLLQREISDIESQLTDTRRQMAIYLKELGYAE